MESVTAVRGAADAVDGRRYTTPAIWLHWLAVPLIGAQFAIAWAMTSLSEHDARAGSYFDFHKSLGITIWLVIAVRLVWRFTHPAPRHGPSLPKPYAWASEAAQWALYLVFFCMPISGYVMSAMGSHGVSLWGLPLPSIPRVDAIAKLANTGHALGAWAAYAIILLHVGGAAWHALVRRYGVIERMIPAQTHADPTRPL